MAHYRYRPDLMTVREMIDAAFVFGEDEPVVDFKLLESILHIIGRQLNVLERRFAVEKDKIKEYKLKGKSTVAISEIKVHRKIGKRTKAPNIPESTTEKSSSFKPQHKKSSRQRSKSKERGADDDDEDCKKHRCPKYGHDKGSNKHGRHRGGYDEDHKKKHGRHRDCDDQDPGKRGRHRDSDSKRPGRRFRDDSRDVLDEKILVGNKHRRHGRSDRGGYDEDYKKKHGQYRDGDDQDPRGRGRHRDSDSKRQGRRFTDDSPDVQHEKILVVSRSSQDGMHDRDHRSAVVTQKQYDKIKSEIRRLQDKFGIVSNTDTGWHNLHQETSLTHPRAALNLATRLDIAQTDANQMIHIVTKFAITIPGFNINEALNDIFVHQIYKESPSSKTPRSTSKTNSEAVEQEEDFLEEIPLDEDNLATWGEFNADMNEIQQNVCQNIASAAANAAETAKRANQLFTQTAPRLSEASMLSVKFARCRTLVDCFATGATALDVEMTSQMGVCQEVVSQLQYEIEQIVERIEEFLTHPAEDATAVTTLNGDITRLLGDLAEAMKNQDELKQLQNLSGLDLEIIRKKLEMINRNKITRDEALEHLSPKASVNDINSVLSGDQLYAFVGYIQKEINQTRVIIDSGEVTWQNCIEDFIAKLNEKGDRLQLLTLQQSMEKTAADKNAQVNVMLDIVGGFPGNHMLDRKLHRDTNCLCCGTPANVQVTEKNMKLAKRLISRSQPTPLVIEEKDTEKLCVPGRPIPHPLDPRALICDRYCGASIRKSEESLTSAIGLHRLDVADMKPTHSDIQNKVYVACTPCNQPL